MVTNLADDDPDAITLGPDEHLSQEEFTRVLIRAHELGFGRGGTHGCILTPATIRAIRDDLEQNPPPLA